MKKYYKSPEFELLSVLTSDIVTLSVGTVSDNEDISNTPQGEPTEAWKDQ